MEETPRLDAYDVEIWIFRSLKDHMPVSFIADELLKKWMKDALEPQAKISVGHFCMLFKFAAPLLRALRRDLIKNNPLQWDLVIELLAMVGQNLADKEILDAILVGTTRDQQLLRAARAALRLPNPDSRWAKIFAAETQERNQFLKKQRQKILDEVCILNQEGMHRDARDTLNQFLRRFPGDPDALRLQHEAEDRNLEIDIADIKRRHRHLQDNAGKNRTANKAPQDELPNPFGDDLPRDLLEEDDHEWPELEHALKQNLLSKPWDRQMTYEMAVGLSAMELWKAAQQVLRHQQTTWSVREHLFDLELSLARHSFLETLQGAQDLLQKHQSDSTVLKACLYMMAKAYYGLKDEERAVSILKGLESHDPTFRDVTFLLREWTK